MATATTTVRHGSPAQAAAQTQPAGEAGKSANGADRAAIERERRRLLSDVRAERDGASEWRLGSGLVLEIPSAWWRSPRDKKGRCC